MFLWVQLQVAHLQEQRTDYDIRNALQSLTRGLHPTFTRSLQSIDCLPAHRLARAKRVLRWVVCAEHPISLHELSEAVVVHDMQQLWDKSRCVNKPISLIEDCFHLVHCTDISGKSRDARVQLIHSSVKEFLLQNPTVLGSSLTDYHIYPLPGAHVTIAEDCLKYLQLIAQSVHQSVYTVDMSQPVEDCHPFLPYASEFWPQHLRASGSSGEKSVSIFCKFMESTPSRQFWSERYNRKRDDTIHTTMSVCHLAARLSLPHIVKAILEKGLDTANAEGFESRGLTALHWAAKSADESTLRVLVESGADIDARNTEGETPLHLAARNWDGEHVVRALLDLRADVTLTDDGGRTPLHIAAQNGYGQNSVFLLLQRGASIEASCKRGQLPLHIAAANPYGVTSVRHLLSYGADVNAQNGQLRTPLHGAAGVWYRGIDSVKVLVGCGANIAAIDMDGHTPLHMAAQSVGGGESVEFLLERGANVDAVCGAGRKTPLHMAARSQLGHEAVRYLLEKGANVEARDSRMQTPLHIAVTVQQDAKVAQTLLAYGADVHALDDSGLTPLQRLAQEGSSDKIMSILLKHGASLHCVDSRHCTPLHWAAGRPGFDDPRLVRKLLQNGANVDARDDSGMTPLHQAAGHDAIVKLLLEHGADVNAMTQKGQTALHLAANQMIILRTLLLHGANPNIVDAEGRTVFDCSLKPEEVRTLVADLSGNGY